MPAWEIKGMGGVIPRTDERLVPDNGAVEAVNCDLTGGILIGLPQAKFLVDLSGELPVVERAYRFPPDDDGFVLWMPLPSRYSSVVRSPLANDVYDRVYWTNPGDISPHVNTLARLKSGDPYYDLGFVYPTTAPVIDSVEGGTTEAGASTDIDRSYCYTYIDAFNEESAPSAASEVKSGPPDATWNISGLPTAPPVNPEGRAYPAVTKMALYRTVTSETSGAQFYYVTEFTTFPVDGKYVDTISDDDITVNALLATTGYRNPPDYLDGLVSMPGGILAGFTGNTVHLTEPDRPYAWPDLYDLSAHYDIISLGVWQQYLAVLTTGYPSTGTGTDPTVFLLTQSQVAEPCISRGSIIVDLSGVYYASQNGLVQLTGYGMQNMTAQILEKNEWLERYHAKDLIACRHRSQFMAVNGTGAGFIIDYAEARRGFEDISALKDVVCMWNDEYTGDTLMCANGMIYEWDAPTEPLLNYRWRSKYFFTPMPLSLGAVQIESSPVIRNFYANTDPPLDNGDPSVHLPDGVNAQFRYYAGPDMKLIMTRNLTKPMEIFRLPNGFKTFDHQIEVTGRVPIYSIQLSTTLDELKVA
jgi:hypothetical protein